MTLATPTVEGVVARRRRPAGAAGAHPAGPAGTRPRTRDGGDAATPRERLEAMSRGFVLLLEEVECGRRPRAHLAPLLTPILYARLAGSSVRAGDPGEVLSARVAGRSRAGVDVVAIVRRGARCGAVALRLVRSPRGWLVDDVALPERGPLPLPRYPVPKEDDEPDDLASIPRADAPRPQVATAGSDWLSATGRG